MSKKHASDVLDLESLEAGLKDPVPSDDFSTERMAETLEQTRALAKGAYEEKNIEAEAQAERILYLIHTANHFAPPLPAEAALIWGVLSRAKMGEALEVRKKTEPFSTEAMRNILTGLLEEAEKNDHPLLDEICAHPDPKGIVIYAKNWMMTAHGFIHQLAALFQRAPNNLKKVVRDNMGDEFEGTEHSVLRDRFLTSIGVRYSPKEALADPDYLFETMAVLNYRTLVTSLSDPFYALGSFYSIEGVFYHVSRRLTQGLRQRGMSEGAIEMFSVHSEVDHDHANEWLESVASANLTDLEKGRVVAGARAQMRIRHRHYEAMKLRLRKEDIGGTDRL